MRSKSQAIAALAVLVFVSMFNLTLIIPSVKELIIDRFDGTTTEASLFVTIEMVAYVIFGMVWGGLSDKRGERRVFIVMGFLGSAVLYYSMALAPNLATLLFLRFCQGAMTVMAWSLIMTLALDIADRREYGASMGLIGSGLALGLGFGAPVGGFLGDIDVLLPLYTASVLFLVCTAVALVVVKDVPITHKPESIIHAISIALRDRRAIPPYMYSFMERFSAGFLVLLLPLYLAYEFDLDPSQRGMFLSAFLLPFGILQYPFGKLSDKRGRRPMLVIGGLAYAALLGTIGLLGEMSVALVMVVCGVLAAMLLPASLALLGDIAPKGDRATFMGGFNAVGSVGFALGPLVAGAFSEAVGYGPAFIMGGVIIAGSVLVSLPILLSAGDSDKEKKHPEHRRARRTGPGRNQAGRE